MSTLEATVKVLTKLKDTMQIFKDTTETPGMVVFEAVPRLDFTEDLMKATTPDITSPDR